MTRTLETLIEQFNRASEIDRVSRIATGETNWIEVDGVRTTMVRAWLNELSTQEKLIFEDHLSKVMDNAAIAMGFESWQQHIKDIGQEVFTGLEMGLVIQQQMLSDPKYWIDFDPDEKVGSFNIS